VLSLTLPYNRIINEVMLVIQLNGRGLTLDIFIKIVRYKEKIVISQDRKEAVKKANDMVNRIVNNNQPVYGINTGFGKLSQVAIDPKETSKLQEHLLISHACGVGKPFSEEIVRGMMLLRINALIRGHSGIRLEVIQTLVYMLNNDVIPVVFEQGSLGASGDLAPLSHMSLPIIGLGECFYKGKRMPSKQAFKAAGISWMEHLNAKEGLALINGTQAMTSIAALNVYDALLLSEISDLSLSLSLEALRGIIDAYDDDAHATRGHYGQRESATRVRQLLDGSKLITKQGELRIQDAYSLRCAPQVHGATLDALIHIKHIIEIEMNAVTDNPILFPDDDKAISAGNFHGQPIALSMDYLAIAIAELANISERRIERLVNPQLSEGLPPFLVQKPGINSGFMIVQYSAASLVSENKAFAHPASVDSIPSSGNQEDHVSMGTIGARKARMILQNTQKVIAMEIFTACQALDLRGKSDMSPITKKVHDTVRQYIPFLSQDELMYLYIHKMEELVQNGTLYNAMKKGEINE